MCHSLHAGLHGKSDNQHVNHLNLQDRLSKVANTSIPASASDPAVLTGQMPRKTLLYKQAATLWQRHLSHQPPNTGQTATTGVWQPHTSLVHLQDADLYAL
mgnify:CR=1 FL=1